jgi:hypothetical protein
MNVWNLNTTRMSVEQLRNDKRMAGVSTPIKQLVTQPVSLITCCLREASEWDKLALNFPFLFKAVTN